MTRKIIELCAIGLFALSSVTAFGVDSSATKAKSVPMPSMSGRRGGLLPPMRMPKRAVENKKQNLDAESMVELKAILSEWEEVQNSFSIASASSPCCGEFPFCACPKLEVQRTTPSNPCCGDFPYCACPKM